MVLIKFFNFFIVLDKVGFLGGGVDVLFFKDNNDKLVIFFFFVKSCFVKINVFFIILCRVGYFIIVEKS